MLRQRTPGQSIVEMSLVVTFLLTILMGSVDIALAFNTRMAMRQAVAEAAYYAAQNPGDDSGIRGRIHNELSWMSPAISDSDITITRSNCSSDTPETQIALAYTYEPLFATVGLAKTMTLLSETTVPQFGGC